MLMKANKIDNVVDKIVQVLDNINEVDNVDNNDDDDDDIDDNDYVEKVDNIDNNDSVDNIDEFNQSPFHRLYQALGNLWNTLGEIIQNENHDFFTICSVTSGLSISNTSKIRGYFQFNHQKIKLLYLEVAIFQIHRTVQK